MSVDFFEGCETMEDIYTKEIILEEKIYDCMPKYYKRDFSSPLSLSSVPFRADGFSKEMRLREEFVKIGMFGFVSWKWINPFVAWLDGRKCLEVMAGRGWLSHALRQKNVSVVATDDFSWANNIANYHQWKNVVTEVEELDAVASIEKYGADVDIVIMSWAYMDNTAYQVLKKLKEVNPKAILVSIGEYGGGCTADDEFHDNFGMIDDSSFYKVSSNYEHWEGLHDSISIGRLGESGSDSE